jgi:two-component system, chemotaxis family, chemotaxis protein CheY
VTEGQRRNVVLVVDDEPPLRSLMRQALEDEGCTVFEAANGAEALRLLRHELVRPPDLILLDIGMPVMDGRAFADVYRREAGQRAPVVVMTAAHDAARAAAEVGADSYVAKPFVLDTFLDVVAHFTGGGSRS